MAVKGERRKKQVTASRRERGTEQSEGRAATATQSSFGWVADEVIGEGVNGVESATR